MVLLWGIGMVGSLCSDKKSMLLHIHPYVWEPGPGTKSGLLEAVISLQRLLERERGRWCCADKEQTGKRKKAFSRW